MTIRHELEITIRGEGVTPSTVPLRELIDLLDRFERAVTSVAIDRLRSPGFPYPRERVDVSVIDVAAGSCVSTLILNPLGAEAAASLVEAVAKNRIEGLPERARNHLRELWKQTFANAWDLVAFSGSAIGHADLRFDGPVARWRSYRGVTTVYGVCHRIGERGRSASLKLLDGTGLKVRLASPELGGRLGERAGESVGLTGEAVWDSGSGKILAFRADELTPYRDREPGQSRPRSVMEGLRALAEVAGDRWDDVDPEAFVRELRED